MPFGAKAGRRWAAAIRTVGTVVATAQLFQAAPSIAGSFHVDPVSLSLPVDKATTSLSIGNNASAPVGIRVSALRWTQVDGKDVYTPTSDVIASPPIFTLDPGGKQLVRLGLRRREQGAAYRVIVEEIPSEASKGTGIRVALRLNLPLYVKAGDKAAPNLRWSAWRNAAGATVLEASNEGAAHRQILSIAALGPDGQELASTRDMGVVLPGSARRWTLDGSAQLPAELVVAGPGGETRSKVLVEQR